MNLGVYTRVSTEAQAKGESLADQEADAREWASRHAHLVVEVFSDAGVSGTKPPDERPGLASLLNALELREIDGFVVRHLDRLARELTVQEAVLAQVWQRDDATVFTFSAEVLRDDPDDPMRTAMRQMVGVFAGLERAMISKRMRDGRRHKAARGEHANGPAPYGWSTVSGQLVPIPHEQDTLQRIRSLRAEGLGQIAIRDRLNAEGRLNRSGGPWSQPVLSRILSRDAARTPAERSYQSGQLATYKSRDSLQTSRAL